MCSFYCMPRASKSGRNVLLPTALSDVLSCFFSCKCSHCSRQPCSHSLWVVLRAMDRNEYLESCIREVDGQDPDDAGAAAGAVESA